MLASASLPPSPRMTSSSGWLLLLACAVVQGVAVFASRRTVVLAIATASIAHLALGGTVFAVACFWLACAVMIMTHRRQLQRVDELQALTEIDEATQCVNRRGFTTRLARAATAASRSGAPLSLIALDLDHFKQVNDQFGHLAGDAVLGEIGGMLRRLVADDGVVARLGGEEFAVLMPETDEEHAGVMAERILAHTRTLRLATLPTGVRLTMSAGIASERMRGQHASDALRARADEALYAAKRNGRDRALLWAPGVHSHATPIRSVAALGR
jgi:diguanylate cyclase (GGDEF)-like protein